uniref:Uncharacterized protein n=1 Tax=Opuntia streptacantha TaxID=393608 RepID=A0A7C9CYF0_OPUST
MLYIFGRNFDGHSKGRERKRVHNNGLIRMKQGPVKIRNNKMHKNENIKLRQVVACTHPRASSKGNIHVRWNCHALFKSLWIKSLWVCKVLLTIVCPICSPQYLPPFGNGESLELNVLDGFSERPEDGREKADGFAHNLPCVCHLLQVLHCQIVIVLCGSVPLNFHVLLKEEGVTIWVLSQHLESHCNGKRGGVMSFELVDL